MKEKKKQKKVDGLGQGGERSTIIVSKDLLYKTYSVDQKKALYFSWMINFCLWWVGEEAAN